MCEHTYTCVFWILADDKYSMQPICCIISLLLPSPSGKL